MHIDGSKTDCFHLPNKPVVVEVAVFILGARQLSQCFCVRVCSDIPCWAISFLVSDCQILRVTVEFPSFINSI